MNEMTFLAGLALGFAIGVPVLARAWQVDVRGALKRMQPVLTLKSFKEREENRYLELIEATANDLDVLVDRWYSLARAIEADNELNELSYADVDEVSDGFQAHLENEENYDDKNPEPTDDLPDLGENG